MTCSTGIAPNTASVCSTGIAPNVGTRLILTCSTSIAPNVGTRVILTCSTPNVGTWVILTCSTRIAPNVGTRAALKHIGASASISKVYRVDSFSGKMNQFLLIMFLLGVGDVVPQASPPNTTQLRVPRGR